MQHFLFPPSSSYYSDFTKIPYSLTTGVKSRSANESQVTFRVTHFSEGSFSFLNQLEVPRQRSPNSLQPQPTPWFKLPDKPARRRADSGE